MDRSSAEVSAGRDEQLLAILTLSRVAGVGPRICTSLLEHFGDAQSVLSARRQDLMEVEGVGPKVAEEIASAPPIEKAQDLVSLCAEQNIGIVTLDSGEYPDLLKRIHDPPIVLYRQGTLLAADGLAVAIVGSRHATVYGLKMAEQLGRGLSLAGFTIVSGLARGIDQAAHRSAIAAGGRTIAVMGGGLLEVYPPEHKELAKQIVLQGALLSEAEPMEKPRGSFFPQRNRIISGLSLGVIVVEAAERSGALISARLAQEQNRDVFAVPGRADSRLSKGCHQLIRDGARLVESVDDVMEELGPLAGPIQRATGDSIHHPAELKLTDQERMVLNAITDDATDVDTIVAKSGLPVQRVLSTVSVLEIRKLIRRLAGGSFCRK